jgi:hypothetical protein
MFISSEKAAFGVSGLLSIAAAPAFAIMALATYVLGSGSQMPGMGEAASPLLGMPLMYALMAVFHAGPWLKLIGGRFG